MMTTIITAESIRELLDYCPETGNFFWRVQKARWISIGELAGSRSQEGYWIIRIWGRNYKAHRLAWLYVYGKWPEDQIDHIDRNRSNNAIRNLREATHIQNCANRPSNIGSSGVRGVTWQEFNNKWRASLWSRRKQKTIGYYSSLEEAKKAYSEAADAARGPFRFQEERGV